MCNLILSSFEENRNYERLRVSQSKGTQVINGQYQVQSHDSLEKRCSLPHQATFFISPVLTTMNDILEKWNEKNQCHTLRISYELISINRQ